MTRSVRPSPAGRRPDGGSVSGTQIAAPTSSATPQPARTTNSPRQSVRCSSPPPIVGARIGPSDRAVMSPA